MNLTPQGDFNGKMEDAPLGQPMAGLGEALERGRSLRIVVGKCRKWVSRPSSVAKSIETGN